jgi:hypothetical protein
MRSLPRLWLTSAWGERSLTSAQTWLLQRTSPDRFRRPSHMRPISRASPSDRYGKGVAETENKAKKKLVSITTETSM